MIHSETLDALSAALSDAQGEFEAVDKSASNPFFKSSYAPLPELVKAATPILSKHGLAVWQGADTDEAGELLWTVVLHKSGQYLGSAARLLPVKNDPQAQGSANTYQRRYQYQAALGLVADEDDDGNAATSAGNRKPASRSQPRKRTPAPARAPDGGSKPPSAPLDPIADDVLAQLRATCNEQQVTENDLAWFLISVGVESLPENPDRAALGAAMKGLNLEQAFKLDALLKGEDEATPGTSA